MTKQKKQCNKMKKLSKIKSISMSHQFAAAIVNCDCSGINDNDIKKLNEVVKEIGTMIVSVQDQEIEFKKCYISDLMTDCITIDIYTFQEGYQK